MGDVDPRTCPTCVNRVKREEPSKLTFDLIFLSLLTPDSLSAKSCTRLERYSKVAHHRNTDNVSSLNAQVHSLIRNSLSALFHWIAPFWVLHFIVLPWQPSLSESPTSLVPFPFIFYFHLSVFSTHSPTLSCTITVTLSFPLFRLTLVFFLFLTTVVCGTDLCSVFLTTVFNKIFMLHSKHLHHIVSDGSEVFLALFSSSSSWHSVCLKLQPNRF